jgi:transposase
LSHAVTATEATLRPGQIIIFDHLNVPKTPEARALIEGAGCTVRFLPPYSPDFHPIELTLATVKPTLRRAGERTFADRVTATGPALDAVTAADAHGFFAHCGYPQLGQVL